VTATDLTGPSASCPAAERDVRAQVLGAHKDFLTRWKDAEQNTCGWGRGESSQPGHYVARGKVKQSTMVFLRRLQGLKPLRAREVLRINPSFSGAR
jgi:hypothetical protein